MNEQDSNKTRTFSIRLDTWLYDKLVAASGSKGKNEYIRNLLIRNLNEQEKNIERTTDEQTPELLKELELKNELLKSKDLTIKTLENEVGFLIADHTRLSGQLDRLLMPSQEEQKEKSKKWFEFWKR